MARRLAVLLLCAAAGGVDARHLPGPRADGSSESVAGCSDTNPCAHNGTCHTLSGVCACVPGYGGPLCQKLLLPSCRYDTQEYNKFGASRCLARGCDGAPAAGPLLRRHCVCAQTGCRPSARTKRPPRRLPVRVRMRLARK